MALIHYEVRSYGLSCHPRGHATRTFLELEEAKAFAERQALAFGFERVYLVRCESLPFKEVR